jgi:trimeric autotransporter adhesin
LSSAGYITLNHNLYAQTDITIPLNHLISKSRSMKKLLLLILSSAFAIVSVQAQVFSLVKDINPGTPNGSPAELVAVNGVLFFQANDGTNGIELWKSDGTAAGTVLVKNINPGAANSYPRYLTVVNGIVFFVADDDVHGAEIWKSDGTESGTIMVKDINPGTAGSTGADMAVVNGQLYFTATNGTHGWELWKTDGSESNTVMVKDIYPGATGSYPYSLVPFNGFLYFGADIPTTMGGLLWKTDGTAAGTTVVKDFSPLSTMGGIVKSSNRLFLTAGLSPAGGLWVSDGTESGTTMLDDNLFPEWMRDVNGTLFFQGLGDNTVGSELWKSDGTVAGTVMVKDIRPGSASSYPSDLININGKLYFLAKPASPSSTRLFRTDGTEAGTEQVVDFQASNAYDVNGIAYFSANDLVHGFEPWKCDGTAAGTQMIQDIVTGNSSPVFFTVAGSKVFASITDPDRGRELWAANIPAGGALPLTLLDFSARLTGNNSLLKWETSSEQNTSHFEIERSFNGRNFSKIGTVAASGNSSLAKQYIYTDADITAMRIPVVYYRLKMSDIDNRFTYSKIIAINISSNETIVMLYPNPASAGDNTTLMIAARKKGNASYSISDINGRTLQQMNVYLNEGSNTIQLETRLLPAGVYIINLSGDQTNRQLKFIKQ